MYSFKLPDIGEGVNEGEIVKWHIKEGEHIVRDQDMVEVMTDKVTVKISSPVEGDITRIYYGEGDLVEVGRVLIDIRTEAGESSPAPQQSPMESTEKVAEHIAGEEPAVEQGEIVKPDETVPEEEEEISVGPALASPAVRRIARERGIKLSEVRGTGPSGRVTLEDLGSGSGPFETTAESGLGAEAPAEKEEPMTEEVGAREAPPEEISRETVRQKVEEISPSEGEEIMVPRGLRRLIFEKMTKSKQIMPHFTIFEEIDVGPIKDNIRRLKNDNLNVSFTPFFIKAASLALRDFPYINAIYDEKNRRYILKKNYNIGVAIDTPDGLTVAVVKNADKKSLIGISSEVSDLAGRARENALKLEEVQDSTFTVTNVGSIAGIMSTPIINYPEVAILGVHRTLTEMTKEGVEREKMYISLSCDHRIIDGAVAARFVKRLKGLLEEPILILSQ